nr:hypothetical protein [uncultured Allomuricauda sp.]
MKVFLSVPLLLFTLAVEAQDLTQNYRKLILNSPNNVSLFQSNSINGIWASGMISADRWGIFEDATSSKEWLTIESGGNIGIGTTNPQEKFQIGESYLFHDGGHKVMGFLYTPSDGVDLDATKYSGEVRFDPNNGNLRLGTSSTITDTPVTRMTIKNTGNIGIGTTSPGQDLEIYGSSPVVRLKNSADGTSAYAWMEFYDVNSRMGYVGFGSSGNDNFYLMTETGGNILVPNGGLGIGTSNPGTYKLAVNGNIRAKEIKVETGWADYVFKEDYDLPTLKEVEKHIQEKGHLINIPSAKEVEENGIQLGEMNKLLLEKIEELTLYTLEQEKKINALKNLKREVEELRKTIIELTKTK